MQLEAQMQLDRALVEAQLGDYVDGLWPYGQLAEAMGYSLLGGGKRLRPILTLAACRYCGGEAEAALPFACAVEMLHTYSLIHDDLPCMDDDDLRRGRPTNHRVFGQANAVLAGDALLTASFGMLAMADGLSAQTRIEAVRALAEATGPSGMVAGQVLDMLHSGADAKLAQIETIQSLKTGKLIVAAVQLGALAAGGSAAQIEALTAYAQKLGLAFQVQDDILDCEGDEEELGKTIGSDAAQQKSTFVSLLGLQACHEMVERLSREAKEALGTGDAVDFLCTLADRLAQRRS